MKKDERNSDWSGTRRKLMWDVFTEELEDGVIHEGQGPIEWGVRRAGRSLRENEGTMRCVIECGHHLQDYASLQPALHRTNHPWPSMNRIEGEGHPVLDRRRKPD